MKRSYVISDWFYRLSHTVRRNKMIILLYALICVLFLVVGIAVGANMSDKTEFVLKNGSCIFKFLRGDIGIVSYFFLDMLLSCVYCLFAASMFFYKALTFISIVPGAYLSYVLGMNVCVLIVVYSVSALPMLFVAFVPICIIEIIILCVISFGCFRFAALNCWSMPPRSDIRLYYKCILKYLLAVAILTFIKALTLLLFGSALIGVI